MTLVKVCGIRTVDEGRVALSAGADWLGFVLWSGSRRYVSVESAAPIIATLRAEFPDWCPVGVFVDPTPTEVEHAVEHAGIERAQLCGDEDAARVAAMPVPVVKAVRVRAGGEAEVGELVRQNQLGAERYLLDAHAEGRFGGTGQTFAWPALRAVGSACFVAGGLRPDTVAHALDTLAPLGVDVSSGVEYAGGGKDPRLVRAFVEAVRSHDRSANVR